MDFPSNRAMRAKLQAIFEKYPGVYYACGHIHALQYNQHNKVRYIISGAGSKANHVKTKDAAAPACSAESCMKWNEKGFFEMDFYSNRQDVILYHDQGRIADKLN